MVRKFVPFCFLTLVFFLPKLSIAQKSITFEFESGRNFTVNDIVDNPDKLPPLRLGASLSYFSNPLDRNNVPLRLSAEYRAGDWGYVHFFKDLTIVNSLDRQYINSAGATAKVTENPTNPYTYTEGGVGFRVWSNRTQQTKALSLKSEDAGYKVDIVYQGNYDAYVDHVIAARAGLFHYRNTITNAYVEGREIRTEEGEIIASKQDYFGNEESLSDPIKDLRNLYQTNMFVTALYLGAEFSTQHNVDYTVEETGNSSSNGNLTRFYGDLLIATNVNFEPMILSRPGNLPTNVKVGHSNQGGLKARNTGFRVGVHNQSFGGISGLNLRLETGIRPGMDNVDNPYGRLLNDWFFTIDMGYVLGLDPDLL